MWILHIVVLDKQGQNITKRISPIIYEKKDISLTKQTSNNQTKKNRGYGNTGYDEGCIESAPL